MAQGDAAEQAFYDNYGTTQGSFHNANVNLQGDMFDAQGDLVPPVSQQLPLSLLNQIRTVPTGPTATGVGYMGEQPKKIQNAWWPGAWEARDIYNQGLADLDPQGYLNQAMASVAGQQNPFMQNLQGFDPSNPYTQALSGVDTANPMVGQLSGMDTSNPYASLLGNFGSQANPYADELFNIGADRIRDQINSQFGMAGQGLSSANFDEQLAQLSDFGAKFYGNIYDQQQNRALDALQSAGNLYGQGIGQGITAAGQAGGLYSQGIGQQLGALGDAGGLYGTGMGQNLQAATQGAQMQNQMNMAPLTLFPSVMQMQQNQPWANLANYTANVAPLLNTGQQPQKSDGGSSGWDKLIGLGTMLGGLGWAPF